LPLTSFTTAVDDNAEFLSGLDNASEVFGNDKLFKRPVLRFNPDCDEKLTKELVFESLTTHNSADRGASLELDRVVTYDWGLALTIFVALHAVPIIY